MGKKILRMTGIDKYIYDAYGLPIKGTDIKILKGVNFDVEEKEVHILVGENGAGKSTLMKILGGIIPHDAGTVELFDSEVRINGPKMAESLGIGFIHQELNLCQNLDVMQNLFLGREIVKHGFIDKKAMYEKSREMLSSLGFSIDPHTLVKNLSTAQQQIVEIVKAISYDSKILIMDEPTASLTQNEIDHLFSIIRSMKEKGMSIIYISHRFEELKEIGDRLTVLRDGESIGTIDMADFNYDDVIRMMVGRTLSKMYTTEHKPGNEEMLKVEGLRISSRTEPINFVLHKGEVVGLGGLVGSGRTEFAKSIFGVRKYEGGDIYLEGKKVENQSPDRMISSGLVYVTEDRKIEGLVLQMGIVENTTLAMLKRLFPSTLINRKKEEKITEGYVKDLGIVCNSIHQSASTLSGGNQQKVVLAKWLLASPKVLILDEPTRGIDVNAKSEIYRIIDNLASQGVAVLMISSDLPELIGMSDRIYVMRRGTISAELTDKRLFTQEEILSHTV